MRDPLEIKSRADFVAFVAELEADLLNQRDQWENPTLERFLEALGASANDIKWDQTVPASLDRPEAWSLAATLLCAGRGYE
jgi:hypothetical protein